MDLIKLSKNCSVCICLALSGCDFPGSSGKTQALYNSIENKQLGGTQDLKLDKDGILIHPGPSPTVVSFAPKGKLGNITLEGSIKDLPAESKSTPGAGTVGVVISIDGKDGSRRVVTPGKPMEQSIDLSKVQRFSISVDNGNNTAAYDWFYLRVK